MLLATSCQRQPAPKQDWEILNERRASIVSEMLTNCPKCIPIDSFHHGWTYDIQEKLARKPTVIIPRFNVIDVAEDTKLDSVRHFVVQVENDDCIFKVGVNGRMFKPLYRSLKDDDEIILVMATTGVSKLDFSIDPASVDDDVFEVDMIAPEKFFFSGELVSFKIIQHNSP